MMPHFFNRGAKPVHHCLSDQKMPNIQGYNLRDRGHILNRFIGQAMTGVAFQTQTVRVLRRLLQPFQFFGTGGPGYPHPAMPG